MGEGIRVLHVDDEPAFLELAGELLERADDRIDVVTAASGREALEVLEDARVDCVVSDYQMPGMDGLGLLEAVRRDHGDLPFVLFTGRGSEDVASDAISAGATDYLQKGSGPERYELLANRVTNAVESHRAVARARTLERIRDIVRNVNQALIRAESREEVERRVCEIISDADPYRFAWMGEVDEAAQRVIPREWAGVDAGYLEDVTITTDRSPTGQGPAGRSVRQRRVVVTQDIQSDDSFEPWRERAIERGFESVAAVPLTHGEDIYGVLGVYANRPDAFDETEIDILEELGDDVGHALHAHAAREKLRRTTARLEAVFEASPDMIDVHDADGTVLAVNDRLCEKLGYEEDDLVGMNVTDVDVGRDPEDLRRVLERLDRGERHEVEGRFRRRDGSTFPVEVHVRRIDLNDEDRYLVVSRDVTEQRRRERAREAVIDRTSDAIVRVDADWRFTFVDGRAEEIYGLDESDLHGRRFWEVFEEALGTPFETAYREAMETREPTTVESRYDALDAWFRVRVYPDDGGGLSFYFRDVTERKRLERELERA